MAIASGICLCDFAERVAMRRIPYILNVNLIFGQVCLSHPQRFTYTRDRLESSVCWFGY